MRCAGLLPTTTVVLVTFCLLACGCRCAPTEPPQQLQEQRREAAIDPLFAADSFRHDDRDKRQLSTVQSTLLNILKPLPVVDVTKEEDKYGNNGDKFNRIGRGLVGGVETISSMLTSALSFPVDTAKKLSRSATEMLNNIGGRLVGLQR